MSTMGSSGKPQSRRYTPREKEQAVRMVHALREELGTSQGTVKRVADQLGYGVESVRGWVKQPFWGTRSRRPRITGWVPQFGRRGSGPPPPGAARRSRTAAAPLCGSQARGV